MITEATRVMLIDILTETEALDKLRLVLDPVSRSMALAYEDMDDQDFAELLELQVKAGLTS